MSNERQIQSFTNGYEYVTFLTNSDEHALWYARHILGKGTICLDETKHEVIPKECDDRVKLNLGHNLLCGPKEVFVNLQNEARRLAKPKYYNETFHSLIKQYNFAYEQGRKIGIEIAQFIPQEESLVEPPVGTDPTGNESTGDVTG